MSVFKRKTSRGETSEYHYRFMSGGKNYFGVCEGCLNKVDAVAYEKRLSKSVKSMAEKETVREIRDEFIKQTGGVSIPLEVAFDLFLKKPTRKGKSCGDKQISSSRSYWRDFTLFMQARHPDVNHLAAVMRSHAEEYVQHLRTEGRFSKAVEYKADNGRRQYERSGNLSPKTVNIIHSAVRAVFAKLMRDAGLNDNPFAGEGMENMANNSESREAFTREELALIAQRWNSFIRAIFVIGVFTGLREGDICTLRWVDIDRTTGHIVRKTLKTGAMVEIPITAQLDAFLREQRQISSDGEFVLPEHAAMYNSNPDGISHRVKGFLERLGIRTTKKVPGRTRAVSVKDVHSLRHTFCYFAGVYGIPPNIVQSIVGHMSPEMTAHYQAHADRQTKHAMIAKMPDLLALPLVTAVETEGDTLRREVADLLGRATIEQLKAAKLALMC